MKNQLWMLLVLALSCSTFSCKEDNRPIALIKDGEQQSINTPVPFVLYQNYPNPFNGTTVITFQLAASMHLTLKVYTEDWQLVSTIVDQYFSVTSSSSTPTVAYPKYTVTFNASDLPSGIYYYILEGGGYQEILTMRLLK
jgi:hypothetical protein